MRKITARLGFHRHNRVRSVLQRMAVLLAVIGPAGQLQSAELVHQFDFNGDLTDTQGTGVSLVQDGNVATSSFGADGWSWTANADPGGGLKLETALLENPQSYSLGFRVKYGNVTDYRKLICFKGTGTDEGLYFHNSTSAFYPFGSSFDVTFATDTFYDFIISRSSDDVIRVYVVIGDCEVVLIYEHNDPTDASVPKIVGGKYQFLFFRDDTYTSYEWTESGTVQRIRVWNGALEEDEIADALSVAMTGKATAVTRSAAELHGSMNPGGLETVVTFEYGPTAEYGKETAAAESPVGGGDNVAVSLAITGLAWNTTYYYRVKGVNGDGTIYGCPRTFTTLPGPDLLVAIAASSLNAFVGQELCFQVVVSNIGSDKASNILLRFSLPPDTEFVAARLIVQDSAQAASLNAQVDGNDIVVELGDLSVEDSLELELILRAAASGTVTLTASVSCDERDTAFDAQADSNIVVDDAYWEIVHSLTPFNACGLLGFVSPVVLMIGLTALRRCHRRA